MDHKQDLAMNPNTFGSHTDFPALFFACRVGYSHAPTTIIQGFLDYHQNFTDDYAYVSEPFEEEYPYCKFVPLSKLTVDETGVKNGSVTSFSTEFYVRIECKAQEW